VKRLEVLLVECVDGKVRFGQEGWSFLYLSDDLGFPELVSMSKIRESRFGESCSHERYFDLATRIRIRNGCQFRERVWLFKFSSTCSV